MKKGAYTRQIKPLLLIAHDHLVAISHGDPHAPFANDAMQQSKASMTYQVSEFEQDLQELNQLIKQGRQKMERGQHEDAQITFTCCSKGQVMVMRLIPLSFFMR